MSFGKGVVSYVFEHGSETEKGMLKQAIAQSTTFGFGSCWSILEDRVESAPELAPVTSIEVDGFHPRNLVDLVKDVEINAALRVLNGLPYWEWHAVGCLDILKGRVTVVRFLNKEKPQSHRNSLERCTTLDLDQVSYFVLRAVLDPTFKMVW